MQKIFVQSAIIALSILLSWDCSKDNNLLNQNEDLTGEEEIFNGRLEIKTEKTQYSLEEVSVENYIFIIATLTNTSQDTFYAKLGDGFNPSIDQDYLSISKWTDGYFEKKTTNNNWENLNLGSLFEGSRIIRILPSKKYNLTASAHLDSSIKGKFRLKVYYYKNYSQTAVDTLKDISNIFSINKN